MVLVCIQTYLSIYVILINYPLIYANECILKHYCIPQNNLIQFGKAVLAAFAMTNLGKIWVLRWICSSSTIVTQDHLTSSDVMTQSAWVV